MSASDRIIALDIGASKLVMAEFSTSGGSPELLNYGIAPLGAEVDSDADPSAFIAAGVRDLMRAYDIRPSPLMMSISGQAVFPRYVPLPPVTKDKILQIIRYEAEQNVPFPIEEVVWDYQLLGDSETGQQNVMLLAVKLETVRALTDCIQATGLEPEIVDAAPMALYNVVRYNYGDMDGCTMVLDMGARSSNLIFLEENKIFSRSITVAGNAITTELMKEFDVSFEEAEGLKLEHAFVAFGGVYAGPDNDVADRVSKIVRNVITRLHAEVNRSINFYRSQQDGNPPSLVLLTGGSSIIPHTDTFFREKINVEVEYLNPFMSVPVSPAIEVERIESEAHLLSEVTGLALRASLKCPVEINLMPPDLLKKKQFRKRQPFFAIGAVGLALIMLCWWAYAFTMRRLVDGQVKHVESKIQAMDRSKRSLSYKTYERTLIDKDVDVMLDLINLRTRWVEAMNAIKESVLDGMWITALRPVYSEPDVIGGVEVECMAFKDKLDNATEGKGTVDEILIKNLKSHELFGDGTKISRWPTDHEAYLRDYTVYIELAKPIKMPARKTNRGQGT